MMREYTVEVTTKGWEAFQMCEFVCIALTVLAKNSGDDPMCFKRFFMYKCTHIYNQCKHVFRASVYEIPRTAAQGV